jgi:hypothetical protein
MTANRKAIGVCEYPQLAGLRPSPGDPPPMREGNGDGFFFSNNSSEATISRMQQARKRKTIGTLLCENGWLHIFTVLAWCMGR